MNPWMVVYAVGALTFGMLFLLAWARSPGFRQEFHRAAGESASALNVAAVALVLLWPIPVVLGLVSQIRGRK